MTVQLVTVKEAAAMLSVHEDTVRRLAARGELHLVRIGSAVRVDITELDALVRRHRPRRPPVEEPEPITDPQRRAFHARAGRIDTAREGKRGDTKRMLLALCSQQFGREITSANDLTAEEASWALDRLEEAMEELNIT
jgi:excisionase family DNA binding protein